MPGAEVGSGGAEAEHLLHKAIIDRAWRDRELRERTAAAGYRYAMALGGEPELIQRLIDSVVSWRRNR